MNRNQAFYKVFLDIYFLIAYFSPFSINKSNRKEFDLDDVPICDLHCDTVMELLAGSNFNNSLMQVNLPAMKAAHVTLQMFACYVPPSYPEKKCVSLVLKMIDRLKFEIEANSNDIMICTDRESIQNARNQSKIAAILAIENGLAIEQDIRNLELFYNRGVRCLTIAHAKSHDWVISSADSSPKFDGLTAFGENVIAAMNEMGMIIDVSHAHDRAAEKVLSITKRSVIASHSGVFALCNTPRNLTDELIKKIADSGGMIGVNFYNGFLDNHYAAIVDKRIGDLFVKWGEQEEVAGDDIIEIVHLFHEFRSEFRNKMNDIDVHVDRIIDHVDYVIQLVGDDFIGFGSDFDGMPHSPIGVDSCSGFKLIRNKLAAKGYSEDTIEKICYKNFLRVIESHRV